MEYLGSYIVVKQNLLTSTLQDGTLKKARCSWRFTEVEVLVDVMLMDMDSCSW